MSELPSHPRVEDILQQLQTGKTREQLVQVYQYKNVKSLDQFMRRNGYSWRRREHQYIHRTDLPRVRVSAAKALDVVNLFQQPNADARSIAKTLKFQSHHDMAQYMQARGYVWSTTEKNYIAQHGQALADEHLNSTDVLSSIHSTHAEGKDIPWPDLFPILSLLMKYRGKLEKLLEESNELTMDIPRYGIPGVYMVKSFHISSELNQLMRAFSEERKVSQREVLEVALIHFFQRFGYQQPVEELLVRSPISTTSKRS